MITFLDLLVIVSMVLIAASLLSLVLMFLIRNKKIQRVCFYITVALSLYVAYVGIRINWLGFEHQAVLAIALALISIGALVLERIKKGNDRVFLYARIASAAALIIGVANALLI
ncbi:MAG: hypothetical protein IKK26_04235 [Clostridia bacterium]|nr:hypothetical protein [Clostridia bacterium]MBR6650023.1 hypothetical protein [Clostridia bacterium]